MSPSIEERARAVFKDAERYDYDTRHAVWLALGRVEFSTGKLRDYRKPGEEGELRDFREQDERALRELVKRDLAGLISGVLNHPNVPERIYKRLDEGVRDVLNDLPAEAQDAVTDSPEYIALVLKAAAGGAER